MKKRMAVIAIAACVAASSVAGASAQSVNAAPKLRIASEVGNAIEQQAEEEDAEDDAEEDASEEMMETMDDDEGDASSEEDPQTDDADGASEQEASDAGDREGGDVEVEEEYDDTDEEEPGGDDEEDVEVEEEYDDIDEEESGDEEDDAEESSEDETEEEDPFSAGVASGATISVSGTGSSTITPDGAILYVGFSNTEESSKEAQAVNAETINAVIDALLDAGAGENDITTSSFDIYADYDYIDGSSVLVGYRVSTMLTVSNLDIDAVGDLIDAAVEAGANEVDGITYTYSDTEEAYDQALQAALERACAKAQLLAASAGGELGGILSIQEEEYSYSTIDARTYSVSEAEVSSDSSSMTVMAGETEITATVVVTYLLEEAEEESAPGQGDAGESARPEEGTMPEHGGFGGDPDEMPMMGDGAGESHGAGSRGEEPEEDDGSVPEGDSKTQENDISRGAEDDENNAGEESEEDE